MTDKNTQIIEAAIRLFAKDGISVPTAKIAKEAGVSNGTLFNYFATKQDLIDDVYFFIKEKIANEVMYEIDIDAGMKQMFFDIWKAYIDWAHAYPLEHRVVELLKTSQMLSEDVKEAGEHFFVAIYEVMEQGIEDKTLTNAPVLYLCEIAAAQLRATISYAQNHNLNQTELKNLINRSFEIYWNGIQA